MTRDEYLEWAKKRALEYLDRGDIQNAIASMGSDLNKHEDFKGISEKLMLLGIWCVVNHDIREARRWIEGFR
jgi:hypothetical protein